MGRPEPSNNDPTQVRAIVSDISLSGAEEVSWIRARLAKDWAQGRPYCCVLHQDTGSKRLQAKSLGAVKAIAPAHAAEELERALITLLQEPQQNSALSHAGAALAAIFEAGRSGDAITPSVVSTCSDFITTALSDIGVRAMIELIWRFDDATHQHCMLVAALAGAFSMKLGFRTSDVERLTGAALLHDVGKSRIPLAVLRKPGKLTAQERAVMATHPATGFEMLRGIGHSDECLTVVRSHHEMLDGSGYPDGLSGHAIPDLVRLVTICDIFAALVERRPYKEPMSGPQAFDVLLGMDGKLDLDFVRAFRPVAMELVEQPAQSAA